MGTRVEAFSNTFRYCIQLLEVKLSSVAETVDHYRHQTSYQKKFKLKNFINTFIAKTRPTFVTWFLPTWLQTKELP
jgi:hypothetical protein